MSFSSPIPEDLLSPEAAAWFPIHIKETAADIFARRGCITPMSVMIARRNPETRFSFRKPALIPTLLAFDSHRAKRPAAEAMRKLAKRADAFAVGMMSEAWTAPINTPEYYRGWEGKLGDHPERIEVLAVSWQHRLIGTGGAMADIIRDAGAPPRLGPWREMPLDGGLLVEFLPAGDQ